MSAVYPVGPMTREESAIYAEQDARSRLMAPILARFMDDAPVKSHAQLDSEELRAVKRPTGSGYCCRTWELVGKRCKGCTP